MSADDSCKKPTAGREKIASGLLVYLMEELGDARLRCAQLKKYIKEATDLIEKSDKRDHFFEVAGHLIYGVPDVLMRLDKALDATALAAARLDYEEIKNNLRPEKSDELENALEDTRLRYLNRRSHEEPVLDKHKVEQWMRSHVSKFLVDKVDVTKLAEAAAYELDLFDGDDVPSELYTWAAEVTRASGHKPLNASKETSNMNAKSAAYFLNKIADLTDKQGRVPVAAVMTLIAKLEKGGNPKTAALTGKASTAFRNIAKAITEQKNPSRVALAGVLRRIVGDTFQVGIEQGEQQQQGQGQQQAMYQQQALYQQQAGAGEDFQKANPKITDEEAKVIDEMHDKNKDVVKDKHQ